MLISPLMGPILANGLALAAGDLVLSVRALASLFISAFVAISFATLLVVLLPFREMTAEIAARTQPNTLDLLIALFSGAVGSIAICKNARGVATSIPGVAIAVAPFPTGDPGAYALVGMGALCAGIIRAPMTSVFMIFELTQDYQILVPLMVANLIAYAIATHFQPKPIYHALLEQDDIHLPGPARRFAAGTSRARDIMKPVSLFIPEDSSVDQASKLIANEPSDVFLVGSPRRISGIVSRQAIEEAGRAGPAEAPLAPLVDSSWGHVHADRSLELALQRFRENRGLLPVLSRGEATRVEGVITLETILEFVRKRPPE